MSRSDPVQSRPAVQVEPFMVVRLDWRAIDRLDPGIEIEGWSWAGWMCSPPHDWRGVVAALAGCAPHGSVAKIASDPGWGHERPLDKPLFPMRPPGFDAPLIDSEETVHGDARSPHAMILGVTWEFHDQDIPREFSDEWHSRMGEKALGQIRPRVGELLSDHGFGDLEDMGQFGDLSGRSYWLNVAMARKDGWISRREARSLRACVPLAPPESAPKRGTGL